MKKQLIAIGLVSFLAVPSVVFAEGDACAPIMSEGMTEEAVMDAKSAAMSSSECMGQRLGSVEEFNHGHGVSLYGSFRTGLVFGSGDTKVTDLSSRWGFQGSAEVAEGLTAAFRYETAIDTANAETSGGIGHGHAKVDGDRAMAGVLGMGEIFDHTFGDSTTPIDVLDENGDEVFDADGTTQTTITPSPHTLGTKLDPDKDGNPAIKIVYVVDPVDNTKVVPVRYATQTVDEVITYFTITNSQRTGYGTPGTTATAATADTPAITADGGKGGRLSYVDLSGGFGTIRLGQIWSASANHYYFKIDPSHYNGKTGGASTRNANSISYSSSAGDVSFQIDKVTGGKEKVEFGATADLGPVGVGVGYWKSGVANDQSSFTGVALSAGAAGVNLTVGLGSADDMDGDATDVSILSLTGAIGDSGITYGVQIANSNQDAGAGDQNLIALTSSLGSGASLIFEFADPSGKDASGEDLKSTSLIGLRVDF